MLRKQVLEKGEETLRKGRVQSERGHPLDHFALNLNVALTVGHVPQHHLKFSFSPHGSLYAFTAPAYVFDPVPTCPRRLTARLD